MNLKEIKQTIDALCEKIDLNEKIYDFDNQYFEIDDIVYSEEDEKIFVKFK